MSEGPMQLSVSISGLLGRPAATPRGLIQWASGRAAGSEGPACVQLDAAMPGLRGRDLSRSARRDLAGVIRRAGLRLSGLDLWIPSPHFASPDRVDRAASAVVDAAALAADLAALLELKDASVVSLTLGDAPEGVRTELAAAADSVGAVLADHTVGAAGDGADAGEPGRLSGVIRAGIDPASVLLAGRDLTGLAAAVAKAGLSAARLSDGIDGARVPVGRGTLDTLLYAMTLSTAGFEGPVVIDLRGLPDAEEGLAAAVESWRAATRLPAG